MTFDIQMFESARASLKKLRAFERKRVQDAIDSQLKKQATVATRNRKPLDGVTADFEFVPPLWELRCDDIRVFYDVQQEPAIVRVLAIRRKSSDQTTTEVLHEEDDR